MEYMLLIYDDGQALAKLSEQERARFSRGIWRSRRTFARAAP